MNLSATVEVAQQRLLGMADDMRLLQHGLFLGFNDERKYPDDDVYQAMIAPTVNETQWVRRQPGPQALAHRASSLRSRSRRARLL